jgi:hypothetical protein
LLQHGSTHTPPRFATSQKADWHWLLVVQAWPVVRLPCEAGFEIHTGVPEAPVVNAVSEQK